MTDFNIPKVPGTSTIGSSGVTTASALSGIGQLFLLGAGGVAAVPTVIAQQAATWATLTALEKTNLWHKVLQDYRKAVAKNAQGEFAQWAKSATERHVEFEAIDKPTVFLEPYEQDKSNSRKIPGLRDWHIEGGTLKLKSKIYLRMKAYFDAVVKNDTHAYKSIGSAKPQTFLSDDAAWSGIFISYVMNSGKFFNQNVNSKFGFPLTGRHTIYIAEAMLNRLNRDYGKPFWLYRIDEQKIEPGDIIVKARAGKSIDFDTIFKGWLSKKQLVFNAKTQMWQHVGKGGVSGKTHADVVSEVKGNIAYTIGGNTEHLDGTLNTVGKKKYRLDSGGSVVEEIYDKSHHGFDPRIPTKKHRDEQVKDYLKQTNDLRKARGEKALTKLDIKEGNTHHFSSPWAVIKIIDRTAVGSVYPKKDILAEWQQLEDDRKVGTLKKIDVFKEVFGDALGKKYGSKPVDYKPTYVK